MRYVTRRRGRITALIAVFLAPFVAFAVSAGTAFASVEVINQSSFTWGTVCMSNSGSGGDGLVHDKNPCNGGNDQNVTIVHVTGPGGTTTVECSGGNNWPFTHSSEDTARCGADVIKLRWDGEGSTCALVTTGNVEYGSCTGSGYLWVVTANDALINVKATDASLNNSGGEQDACDPNTGNGAQVTIENFTGGVGGVCTWDNV